MQGRRGSKGLACEGSGADAVLGFECASAEPGVAGDGVGGEGVGPQEVERWRARAPVAGIFRRIAGNVRTHGQVRRLLHLPAFIDTVQNNPKFAFKYLTWRYLARGLTVPERAACFLHHYQRLHTLLPDRVLRQVLHWDVPLYELHDGGNCFTVSLGRSRPFYKEGELSLHLKIDGEIFFTLAFTIVPGWVVGSKAGEVLLISRLQGTPGCYPEQMKLATKAMDGVRPRTALLCGLEGMARACGIGEVAGVSAGAIARTRPTAAVPAQVL